MKQSSDFNYNLQKVYFVWDVLLLYLLGFFPRNTNVSALM